MPKQRGCVGVGFIHDGLYLTSHQDGLIPIETPPEPEHEPEPEPETETETEPETERGRRAERRAGGA